jgi:hypothetical protein
MEQIRDRMNPESTQMSHQIPCESEHEFVLTLDRITEPNEEVENALFDAGCDDCTIATQSGRVYLSFTRIAGSISDAILTAIRDVRKAGTGATILRVDNCNLVTQSEIGRKIGRTRQQVHQYVTGERGPGGFPPPACHIADKASLWRWCEVAHWLYENGILKENALRAAQAVDAINSVLEFTYQKNLNRDLVLGLLTDLNTEVPVAP